MNSLCLAVVTIVLAADAPTQSAPSPLASMLGTPIIEKDASFKEMHKLILDRVPPLVLPPTAEEWDRLAPVIRRRFLDEVVLKGHDPGIETGRTNVEWLGRMETGKGYVIRTLRYEGWPGMWIPALLYEPEKLEGKVPLVLNPNGHERGDGKAAKYKQMRCINIAKRGMLALNQEWLAMGELNLPGYDHMDLAYLDLCGRAGVGVFYMVLKRGLDVLLDHPNADPSRTAVTGLSGGGWQTIFFSSLDDRVKLAAPNAGYCGMAPRAEFPGDTGDLEQCPCDQLTVGDYTHMTALLAPRPALLIYNEKDNCCFPTHRAVPSVYDPVVPLYKLYNKVDDFQYHNNRDPGNHNYEIDNRRQFYKFLNRHFVSEGQRNDEEFPSEDEIRSKAQLALGVPKDNANFWTLSEAAAARLPEKPLPQDRSASSLQSWSIARRVALRATLRLKPMTAMLVGEKEAASSNYTAKCMTLAIGRQWHIPVVDVSPKGRTAKSIAIVIADGGRAKAESLVDSLLKDDYRVLAVDLLFTGQCVPQGFSEWAYAMLMANVGERPLGQKVGQLLAVMDYAAGICPGIPITVAGIGRTSSVTTVLTAALADNNRPSGLITVGLPASLKLLIEKRLKYQDAPSLFCFGLLKEADICELLAMALPARMTLIKTEGEKERVEKALAPFARLAKETGRQDIDLFRQTYER